MKPIQETNSTTWTAQIWPGNSALNLQCSCKFFRNPFTGKQTAVWLFGGTKEYPGFSVSVNDGANSSYSYTGRVGAVDLYKAQDETDDLYQQGKLFK